MLLNQIRFSPNFLDTRAVHASRNTTVNLFEECLRNLGAIPQEFPSHSHGCPLKHLAVNPRPALELFRQGNPKIVRYAIEEESPNITIVKMEVGYGTAFEWVLLILTLFQVAWLNALPPILLFLKKSVHPDDFVTMSLVAICLVLSYGLWLSYSAWESNKIVCCSRFPSRIYQELLTKSGLRNTIINAPNVSWTRLILHVFFFVGLSAVVLQLALANAFSTSLLIFLIISIMAGLGVMGLFANARHTLARWNMGLASFCLTISSVLYFHVPLLAAFVYKEDANRLFTNIQQGHNHTGEALLLVLTLVLVVVGSALFLFKAILSGKDIALAIDNVRSHPELQVGGLSEKNWQLAIVVMPMCVCLGVLAVITFLHCVIYLQSALLGTHRWLTATNLEMASQLFNTLLSITFSICGFSYTANWPGKIAAAIFSLPILAWGCTQLWFAIKESSRHFALLKKSRKTPTQINKKLDETVISVSTFANISPPRVLINSSDTIYAYVAISPLPFLPRVLVLSDGALTKLSWPSVQAIVRSRKRHLSRWLEQYCWLAS